MVKLNKTVEVQVDAKKIHINVMPRDAGFYTLTDQDGNQIHQHDGYVPGWLPGEYGDYLRLTVDLETGQILNWKVPTAAQIEEWMNETT